MIPKDAKLMGLHLFYKNDLPQGFGVGLGEGFFTDNPEMESQVIKCSQLSINEYKKQKTDKERAEFIADIQSQFNEACAQMNEHKGEGEGEGAIDGPFLTTFLILLDDMSFLQSVGLFVDDNFNGPQWSWCKDKEVEMT